MSRGAEPDVTVAGAGRGVAVRRSRSSSTGLDLLSMSVGSSSLRLLSLADDRWPVLVAQAAGEFGSKDVIVECDAPLGMALPKFVWPQEADDRSPNDLDGYALRHMPGIVTVTAVGASVPVQLSPLMAIDTLAAAAWLHHSTSIGPASLDNAMASLENDTGSPDTGSGGRCGTDDDLDYAEDRPVTIVNNGQTRHSRIGQPRKRYSSNAGKTPAPHSRSPPSGTSNWAGTRRQERNRVAARRSRTKGKEYIQELEAATVSLVVKNTELLKDLRRLRQEYASMASRN